MPSRSVAIRDATADDVQLIFRFIQNMAEFDGRLGALQTTPDMIREGLFGVVPHALVLLAEVDGVPVGFASTSAHIQLSLADQAFGLMTCMSTRKREAAG